MRFGTSYELVHIETFVGFAPFSLFNIMLNTCLVLFSPFNVIVPLWCPLMFNWSTFAMGSGVYLMLNDIKQAKM